MPDDYAIERAATRNRDSQMADRLSQVNAGRNYSDQQARQNQTAATGGDTEGYFDGPNFALFFEFDRSLLEGDDVLA